MTLVYSTAVTVGFQMESYTVGEDEGTLEVCIFMSGERERGFSVDLLTPGGTALGECGCLLANYISVLHVYFSTEWADFDPLSVKLVFNPDTSEVCTNISITNDTVLEGNEEFSAILIADPYVILSPDSATIIIMDDDSE